ncbi:leucine rich adaptor protein 1-like [Antennarius striatus]|uniref:leucine rich adaptor protein 1-like n=1 Tax=Antennarius striatus TaxID=241820 RepID=UPI0035AF2ABF
MEEEILPDLRELETKVGRKTPESLLEWIRDGADPEGGWRTDAADAADAARRGAAASGSLTDRLNTLRREMRLLRSADVRILLQLLALNEGMEALRWALEEDASALNSPRSSWTGSLSSLGAAEEQRGLTSPGRVSQTPSFTESIGEEFADPPPYTVHCALNTSSQESTEPPSPPAPNPGATRFTAGRLHRTWSSPARWRRGADGPKPQWRDTCAEAPPGRPHSDVIFRALMRSGRSRREARDAPAPALSSQSEEMLSSQEHLRANRIDSEAPGAGEPHRQGLLFAYDTQWCWVDAHDDVMPV